MKSVLTCAAALALTAIVLYAAINPVNGIVFQSPTAAIGVGLIGLGLCKHAHDRRKASAR